MRFWSLMTVYTYLYKKPNRNEQNRTGSTKNLSTKAAQNIT